VKHTFGAALGISTRPNNRTPFANTIGGGCGAIPSTDRSSDQKAHLAVNITSFLDHWNLAENPFRDEEALHDAVFRRLQTGATVHPDFEKILGDLNAPATSIVFGEKGSGKTAIRLQLTDRIKQHNARSGTTKVFLVPYDELNPILDRFAERVGLPTGADQRDAVKQLSKFRLTDHMDAMLHVSTASIVDAALDAPARFDTPSTVDDADLKMLKRSPAGTRHDMLLLAAMFDKAPLAGDRMRGLRRRLGVSLGSNRWMWRLFVALGWLPAAAVIYLYLQHGDPDARNLWLWGFGAAFLLYLAILAKYFLWDRIVEQSLARKVARHLRVTPRGPNAMAEAFAQLPKPLLKAGNLPMSEHDETRYELFGRLWRVLSAMNYHAAVVLVDRVDEPALINGDGERMRAIVWPLMNNKFLQMPHFAVKALLPVELRHELFRESAAFFQGARLDKQNLVERLSWTGPMLYDLCNARLNACRQDAADPRTARDDQHDADLVAGEGAAERHGPLSLASLFADDVSRQDIVDALDQMHQPRDAFKLIYQCIAEHCSNVTEEQADWRIPRLTLDTVRKQQSDRVQMFYRGIRPA